MSLDQAGLAAVPAEHVELRYWSGCPSHRQAGKLLERILEEIGAADTRIVLLGIESGGPEAPARQPRPKSRRSNSTGDLAPAFSLPDAAGGTAAFAAGTGPAVVVFTCNHCPCALAWHQRINDAARPYGWLRTAIDEVLASKPVGLSFTEPVGCSIKWRS